MVRAVALLAPLAMLAACTEDSPEPEAVETEIPESLQDVELPEDVSEEAAIGTPMEERVATIGLLNKRNNLSQELELSPGDQQRVGDVIIRLRACERTAPWEFDKDEGAFVQVLVRERGSQSDFRRIFSGWLFKNKPSINVVEHPIYDVWVKSCAMEFPGEE
ncbi:DUF2155 domain-containing protein [Qipengyuania huizhouensis]|uniref:DUF2155 domain-containing protein n=1 Tax=Qipengyuania huizhouensis TaxID=2867245 RepID=UPI0017AE17AF|nr:DUF2155 domain-containing protein [Qipengyuania huizhouensis]MBA4765260.1 DUF2155 domain-containing protein [Erythrobacter sp.]MBX7461627.1 DUF2155 domain-containing protein [Qipengyuania huizhouensis]